MKDLNLFEMFGNMVFKCVSIKTPHDSCGASEFPHKPSHLFPILFYTLYTVSLQESQIF